MNRTLGGGICRCGRLTERLLEELEFTDRPIGLIIELIFVFGSPNNVADCTRDANEGDDPPNKGGKGG